MQGIELEYKACWSFILIACSKWVAANISVEIVADKA
jgi:hypothetical protein